MFIIETYIVSTHLRWKPGQLPNISNESHLKSPSLPRSTMELAVQLFCIPVEGTKSESKERFASKLESNIREDRTFLMRLETWSCNHNCDDIMGTSGRWCLHLHLVVGVPCVRGLPLYRAARDVPVVRAIAVLKIFATYFYILLFDTYRWNRTHRSQEALKHFAIFVTFQLELPINQSIRSREIGTVVWSCH